jgi:tetratricopeptide (TPR) repeat protein
MNDPYSALCPDADMTSILQIVQADDVRGLAEIEVYVHKFPSDPRLFFLKGSVLAALQRYDEGRLAMSRSIEIAPGFNLARFQLGFLEYTSGLVAEALQTWRPFDALPENSAFRLFANGLTFLAQDDFTTCDQLLRLGIEHNQDHPLINGDMELILTEIAPKLLEAEKAETMEPAAEVASATHQLLQQFELRDVAGGTKH